MLTLCVPLQHLSFLSGTALATVNGKKEEVTAGDVVIVRKWRA